MIAEMSRVVFNEIVFTDITWPSLGWLYFKMEVIKITYF
jgi:hypothetical protein